MANILDIRGTGILQPLMKYRVELDFFTIGIKFKKVYGWDVFHPKSSMFDSENFVLKSLNFSQKDKPTSVTVIVPVEDISKVNTLVKLSWHTKLAAVLNMIDDNGIVYGSWNLTGCYGMETIWNRVHTTDVQVTFDIDNIQMSSSNEESLQKILHAYNHAMQCVQEGEV